VYLGIAIASGLSVTHGFLPPHPGPTAIVVLFKADMGRTLIYGTLIAIPTILLTGGLFPEFLKHIKANPPQGLIEVKNIEGHLLPPFSLSIGIALTPVLLMAMATIGDLNLHRDSGLLPYLKFVGDPAVSMIIAFLIALVFIGILRGGNDRSWKDKMDDLMGKMSNSLSAAVMIFLIIGSGGAFKQVLQDSGIGSDLALIFNGLQTNPLILGWLVATIIRISIGSATVAGLTAAGIVQPLLADPSVSPELMVLSVGAGSLMCSHVNDTGFWMFKEYFGLTLKDTFLTWTLMETIVGIGGLIGVLVLDIWL
jgi:Gnt-I system high-affinity gluconate transporter/Gnt-II system L-idonate transporter